MSTIRIATYNVENLFARPKVFRGTYTEGQPVLKAYKEINELFKKSNYSSSDKKRMTKLLLDLDIYYVNKHGAIRKRRVLFPKWAWLRKNRGTFDSQPKDSKKDVIIKAKGRSDWIGWVELAVETTNEKSIQMTAKVIKEIKPDILGIVEAEDRPSLVKFNKEEFMLNKLYSHVMLVDGNDERGIDVGILTKNDFKIKSIVSNVDERDSIGTIFSRDCPQYEVVSNNGVTIHVLVNHFKSQAGGGGPKRLRQSKKVKSIVKKLISEGQHVVVLGDLNEGIQNGKKYPVNLKPLFDSNSPLIDVYQLDEFEMGSRPGTYGSCAMSNRLDYILISPSLKEHFVGGNIFRKGLWGSRKSRPDKWETYSEMTNKYEQASDHALIYADFEF